jgi:hypothetical protein
MQGVLDVWIFEYRHGMGLTELDYDRRETPRQNKYNIMEIKSVSSRYTCNYFNLKIKYEKILQKERSRSDLLIPCVNIHHFLDIRVH